MKAPRRWNPLTVADEGTLVPMTSIEGASTVDARGEWLSRLRDRLSALMQLPKNWDTYGAGTISCDTILFTAQVLQDLWKEGLPIPDVTPLSAGGVMSEWVVDGREFSIEISQPMAGHFTFDGGDVEPIELAFSSDLTELEACVDKLLSADETEPKAA